jgi:hypothetical protein
MHFNYPLANGQAQASSHDIFKPFYAIKLFKDALQILFRDARTVIFYRT